jgi:hypothetical protein
MATISERGAIADRRRCASCGTGGATLRCSRCHAAWYCNRECQTAHWPAHKSLCKPRVPAVMTLTALATAAIDAMNMPMAFAPILLYGRRAEPDGKTECWYATLDVPPERMLPDTSLDIAMYTALTMGLLYTAPAVPAVAIHRGVQVFTPQTLPTRHEFLAHLLAGKCDIVSMAILHTARLLIDRGVSIVDAAGTPMRPLGKTIMDMPANAAIYVDSFTDPSRGTDAEWILHPRGNRQEYDILGNHGKHTRAVFVSTKDRHAGMVVDATALQLVPLADRETTPPVLILPINPETGKQVDDEPVEQIEAFLRRPVPQQRMRAHMILDVSRQMIDRIFT